MGVPATHCVSQFIDNMRGRWLIRITHPEIDDVLTTRAGDLLELANNIEDVRRQSLNPLKVCIQNCFRLSGLTQSNPRTAAKSAAGR